MSPQRVINILLQIFLFFYVLEKVIKLIKIPEQELECLHYKYRCNGTRTLIRWLFAVTNIVGYLYTLSMIDRLKLRSNNHAEAIKGNFFWTIYNWINRQVFDILPLNDYIRDLYCLPSEELMKHEWARLQSFNTYPDSSPHFPIKLAKAGFYYTGKGKYIKCFCCGLGLDSWPTYETIDETHRRLSPDCSFVRGESNNNPIQQPHDHAQQNAGPGWRHAREMSLRYPEFESVHMRRITLSRWSLDNPSSESVAEAGLFYTGTLDLVRCFCCGIGLKDWCNGDEPWTEHARWSPHCEYVKQCKGEQFIRRIEMADAKNDFNSAAAQRILAMGHSKQRVKEAILEFRKKHGRKELSAKQLLDYIMDTEPNLVKANASGALPTTHTIGGSVQNGQSATEQQVAPQIPKPAMEDSERLREHTLCKVCHDETVCIVFLPCGHLVTCASCAPSMRKCPICRALVKNTVRTYML